MHYEYNEYTDTIRIQPQNYLVAERRFIGAPWTVCCDPALPTHPASVAFVIVHENHALRWGEPRPLVDALNRKLRLDK